MPLRHFLKIGVHVKSAYLEAEMLKRPRDGVKLGHCTEKIETFQVCPVPSQNSHWKDCEAQSSLHSCSTILDFPKIKIGAIRMHPLSF